MVLHIIVLIFEVLYYSMFMKFARKEGKFWRYLLLFSLITIVMIFIGTNTLYAYLIFVLLALYGLKYIVKIKTSFYDMFIIVIMMMLKLLIETPIYLICINFIKNNHFIVTLLMDIIKIGILFLLKNRLNIFYIKLKKLWQNNNFYLRYIFTCIMYIYVIITIILLIFLIWEV